MKKLVISSIETDGHSATSCFIATSDKSYQEYLRSLLYYEGELKYTFLYENKIDDTTLEQVYSSELGEMSILVKTFSAYKNIENTEYYTRTG